LFSNFYFYLKKKYQNKAALKALRGEIILSRPTTYISKVLPTYENPKAKQP
jgi:hypothetical protein